MQHKDLEKSWLNETIGYQMANIGSEVSRAIKNRNKPTRFQGAFDRALELFDLTILSLQKKNLSGELREVCRAREEFCDYFNDNEFKTDPIKMQKYYDQFASLRF